MISFSIFLADGNHEMQWRKYAAYVIFGCITIAVLYFIVEIAIHDLSDCSWPNCQEPGDCMNSNSTAIPTTPSTTNCGQCDKASCIGIIISMVIVLVLGLPVILGFFWVCIKHFFCIYDWEEPNIRVRNIEEQRSPGTETIIVVGEVNDTECPICMEKLETDVIVLPFAHLFHSNCIEQWRAQKHTSTFTCPICRAITV